MKNVFFIGAPTVQKGIEDFNFIAESIHNARFFWFTYHIEANLRNKYRRITFVTGMETKKLHNHLKSKMDIFICCSRAEGFCLPIAESMLLHKPVLSYALDELVSVYGSAIEYVDCFDRDQFVLKLSEVIKNKLDVIKINNSKKYIDENYLPHIVVEKLLKELI